MKRVGILGGTFDPPHIGHLIIAEEVYYQLDLDEVWFLPSNHPPHKSGATADNQNRLEMVKAAIADNPHFSVSDIELQRDGKSYTYDTIKQLKKLNPDIEFYFIIGGDMVEYLPKWYEIKKLMKMTHFVGVKRSGYQLNSPYPVEEVEMPIIEVSSTMLRKRLNQGREIRYLTADGVIDYIKEHQLYEA
ncbi:nicotinate-nucleotide adenylyltransferase [Thalassobacillus devorans]|uniref:nicotinate-nucleotide adenylyltransferase n=1 Tax=Thalassobacillus devorans TaxID=279813 RepID=UPI000A1C86B1|nr:nicotinate-nucleotide adenylyltransferase [Thalassobacillus devorans]